MCVGCVCVCGMGMGCERERERENARNRERERENAKIADLCVLFCFVFFSTKTVISNRVDFPINSSGNL